MPPIPAAVFTVKEHMLLRIIIYLFQFLLCLIQVTLAYCRLRNRLRQTRTITHLTSIRIRDSHYQLSNLLSPPHSNNENHGLSLKSNHHSKTGSSTPHNNHLHHYNPRADETDYDDYETPEIGNIHGDEVYNNID
jgi:hypothetical protein